LEPGPKMGKRRSRGTAPLKWRLYSGDDRWQFLLDLAEEPGRTLGGTVRSGIRPALEGQDGVHDLLTVAWLLHIGDLAAPTVGNPGFGDLG